MLKNKAVPTYKVDLKLEIKGDTEVGLRAWSHIVQTGLRSVPVSRAKTVCMHHHVQFCMVLGSNLGIPACEAGTLSPELHPRPFKKTFYNIEEFINKKDIVIHAYII